MHSFDLGQTDRQTDGSHKKEATDRLEGEDNALATYNDRKVRLKCVDCMMTMTSVRIAITSKANVFIFQSTDTQDLLSAGAD